MVAIIDGPEAREKLVTKRVTIITVESINWKKEMQQSPMHWNWTVKISIVTS